MKAQKIIMIVSAGVVLLLCLGGFVMAYQAYSKASTVKATLGGTFHQLEGIYNENPFPNSTNMAVLRSDTTWTTNWYQSLVMELRLAALPPESLSSSRFIEKLQDTSAELHRKAMAEGGKVLADGFAFGFDRYLGSKSSMPKPENVKKLEVQFMMVEAIAREILDSHVSALTEIDREKFEGGDVADAPAASGRHRPQPAGVAAAPVTGVADSHYTGQHFTFSFTADEKALSEVLSRMAKMPMCVVVTELKIDRLERGLRPRSDKTAVEADKPKTAVEIDKPTTAKLPRTQRVVSGPEISPLLKTQMQVDVYTFEGV